MEHQTKPVGNVKPQISGTSNKTCWQCQTLDQWQIKQNLLAMSNPRSVANQTKPVGNVKPQISCKSNKTCWQCQTPDKWHIRQNLLAMSNPRSVANQTKPVGNVKPQISGTSDKNCRQCQTPDKWHIKQNQLKMSNSYILFGQHMLSSPSSKSLQVFFKVKFCIDTLEMKCKIMISGCCLLLNV